jgi:hypothetical protein
MIYSAKHNFLLLKNYKVGGTSLEVELSQTLDDSAIITPIIPANKLHKPRNYNNFYNHISYSEIEKILGKEILDKTETVVFIRNPFDIVLSHMYMSFAWEGITSPIEKNVDDYFENNGGLKRITGAMSRKIYTKDNNIIAKTVYKYEDGLDQINQTLKKVGINSILINAKEKMYRPKEIKPAETFKSRHVDIISEEWDWEIKQFDYSIKI